VNGDSLFPEILKRLCRYKTSLIPNAARATEVRSRSRWPNSLETQGLTMNDSEQQPSRITKPSACSIYGRPR
jgi:hypothetical protein